MVDIRRLDEATVERIAAGEVVERPASVVKELVENSLDADASRVDVAVEAGGKAGIRVSDDGVGMTEDEVRRAVEQHTTSKIRDIDDLEGGVATLGFRGEALHAIGAVSRVTITTRPRSDRDDVGAGSGDSGAGQADTGTGRGTEIVVEGGEVTSVRPAGCPEGTTIEVEDLFYNVPARRKYLKQDATEFAHVNTVVTSYALANPDVAVSLTHDGRETFATTGQGNRREAVMAVYGRDVARSMVEVDAEIAGADAVDGTDGETGGGTGGPASAVLPDGPLDGVSGLVSHPETNRASREYLSTYVNGRYVTAGTVRDAVVDAYDTQLAPDRYPFAVLFLDVPAGDVDVNVHPRKLDVRFADEAGVRRQIRTAVEDALLDAGLLRSGAPRGKSAPDEADVTPGGAGDADGGNSGGDRPETVERFAHGDDQNAVDREVSGSASGTRRAPGETVEPTDDGPAEPTDSGTPEPTDAADAGGAGKSPVSAPGVDEPDSASTHRPDSTGDGETTRGPTDAGPARKFRDAHDQSRLGSPGGDAETSDIGRGASDAEAESFESLPAMRILGQFQETYVVAETADGLVLVDQHAADERVNYERLRERFDDDVTTQALAEPVELSLTAREAELFEGFDEALATLGFRAERAGDRTVTVRTVPSLLAGAADPDLLRDVLGAFVGGDGAAAETVEAAADELLADLACYPSITGNTSLTEGSVRDLLTALDDCENPWACPHGRPVVVELATDEIEARFERDYPGHGGRRE